MGKPPAVYEIELRERMLRVEEDLKHQRELIQTILNQMEKRFDASQMEMNRRFEAVDKRFETLHKEMNQRFEQLMRRIDRFMFWSFATTLTVGGLVMAALKLFSGRRVGNAISTRLHFQSVTRLKMAGASLSGEGTSTVPI